jgi:hypothetical protein
MAVLLAAGCGKKADKAEETASELGEAPARGAERRPYVINSAGIRFDPPAAWDVARVDVVTRSGEESAAILPGADFSVTFEYKAEQPAHRNSALLHLYVFPKANWSSAAEGEVIDSTGDWVFVAAMADANPYREGLLDADQFEAMRLTLDEIRESFSIENGGPADATLRAEKRK